MSEVERVKTTDVLSTIQARVSKLCPFKNEPDAGAVTIVYQTRGRAMELHSLRAYLDTFARQSISHEDFTTAVAKALRADVTSRWVTAGMQVECRAVLR